MNVSSVTDSPGYGQSQTKGRKTIVVVVQCFDD